MKAVHALMIILLFMAVLAAGCINPFAMPTPTPAPAPTVTPTTIPTITATPGPSTAPHSPVFMPNQTTNGRTTYPSPSIPSIANGSKKGGQIPGELGRQ